MIEVQHIGTKYALIPNLGNKIVFCLRFLSTVFKSRND